MTPDETGPGNRGPRPDDPPPGANAEDPHEDGVLDLTANPYQVDVGGTEVPDASTEPKRVADRVKTIEEEQEKIRGRLAQWLTGATIVIAVLLVFGLATDLLTSGELKDGAAAILSPLVALAGTATGFYFGKRS